MFVPPLLFLNWQSCELPFLSAFVLHHWVLLRELLLFHRLPHVFIMSGHNISSLPGIASNITSITQCTPALCSLDPYAVLDYVPNAGSNFLFACIFAVLTLAQLWFWIRHRTHSFSFSMCVGLILEILGYLARVIMKHHMFESGPFLM